MNYYKISPLTKIPLNRDPLFTYSSLEKLSLGALVEIPFGPKKIRGVIFEKTKKPSFKTRPVEKITHSPFLTKNQLILAKKISEYYFSPLGVTLKFFIPKLTKKETTQSLNEDFVFPLPKLTKDQNTAVRKIDQTVQSKTILLQGPASSGKTEVIMKLIEKRLKKNEQGLILVPELFLSYQEIARFHFRFKKYNLALYHSALKPSETTCVFNQVKNGKIELVVSTRMGLFLPFKKLGLIAMDEEQDISYKQWDQNPHYHARKVSAMLATIHKAKLIHYSATPSLETIHQTIKELKRVTLSSLKTKKIIVAKPRLEIVDIKKYYQKEKQIIISKELSDSIKEASRKNCISCLFVPQRGKSRLILCRDCKKTLRCPKCSSHLIHSGNSYGCLHCKYKVSSLSKCPSCGSFRFVNIGFGTEGVAEEIKTIFPKLKIEVADAETFKKRGQRKKLFKKLQQNSLDILVGTYAISKGFDIKNVELIAILSSDNWAGANDFRFDERYLANLFQLAGRVNRPGSSQNGKFILQTFNPQNPLLKYLKKWSWEEFSKSELANRKSLDYPPFSRLVMLTFKHQQKKKIEKNVKKTYNTLSKINSRQEYILPLLEEEIRKERGRWTASLLIKFKSDKISARMKEILFSLSGEWDIDVDPEIIF